MPKNLLITEKPSVAMEFAKVLQVNAPRRDGYLENESWIITWCRGHLVTMSYPEKYDEKLKMWRLDTLPFALLAYKCILLLAQSRLLHILFLYHLLLIKILLH